MTQINTEDLEEIRENNKDKKIVFTSGSFDLVHAGHILFFEDAKKQGDILVIAIGRDLSIKADKGENRPILNEHIRIKTIDSLKPVDYVFMNSPKNTLGDAKNRNRLETIELAFKKLKPEVYVINEDAFDIEIRRKLCAEHNVELKILKRFCPPEFENISTSKIIKKIKDLD